MRRRNAGGTVSIPHRKVAGRDYAPMDDDDVKFPSLIGRSRAPLRGKTGSSEEMFPSLIGRSRALLQLRGLPIFGKFPSLIGRSRAMNRSGYVYLDGKVSIPHRKVAGARFAAASEVFSASFHPS